MTDRYIYVLHHHVPYAPPPGSTHRRSYHASLDSAQRLAGILAKAELEWSKRAWTGHHRWWASHPGMSDTFVIERERLEP